jgi:hypothetical protein
LERCEHEARVKKIKKINDLKIGNPYAFSPKNCFDYSGLSKENQSKSASF